MASKFSQLSLFLAVSMVPFVSSQAASDDQKVSLSDNVQIPGGSLKAGSYTFTVEGRLSDRSIIRVSSPGSAEHFLLLAVPNDKVSVDSATELSFFKSGENQQALRAWKCPTCSAPLELVYPKLEAVAITDASTIPVLAVDPSYDKLPAHLSQDDMKVVTLWLLSPERIANNVGEGVKAAKYASDNTLTAQATPPANSEAASPDARQHRKALPKTASNNPLLILGGLLCFAAALTLQTRRRHFAPYQK